MASTLTPSRVLMLALTSAALTSCAASEIDMPTGCTSSAECRDGRVCLLGFCQEPDPGPTPQDMSAPVPDMPAPVVDTTPDLPGPDLPDPVEDMTTPPEDMSKPDMQDMEPPCVPKTCADLNATCGTPSDGCSQTLNCGTCAPGLDCQNGICLCNDCGLWSYDARLQRWSKSVAPLISATHGPLTPIRAAVRTKDSQEVVVFTDTSAHLLELRRNPPEWTNSTQLALPPTVQGTIVAAWAQGGDPEYIALLMANQGTSHVALVEYESGLNFDLATVQRIEYGPDWTMGALAPDDRTKLRAMWYAKTTPPGLFPQVSSATCATPTQAFSGVIDDQKVYAFESEACFEFLYQSSQSLYAPFMLPDAPDPSLITGAYHNGDAIFFTLGEFL